MTVIYAERPPLLSQTPGPVGRLRMSWTGWDGSLWDLTDPDTSGVVLAPGVRGLGMPPAQLYTSESPAVAGARFRGSRTLSREVFWPLHILADPGQGWADLDGAFWRTMRADSPGSWAVTSPSGSTRTLTCRWVSGGDEGYPIDPTSSGWARYDVYLVADDDPYWTGAPVVRTFAQGASSSFFGAGAPPFTISPGNLLASATMDNPGDVEAHPIWRVDGPVTSVTVGVNGQVINAPITVASGASLTIDTRPTAQTAIRSDGTDVTGSLTGEPKWVGVPAGQSVPLSLTMTGTGSVTATITPHYLKAWG